MPREPISSPPHRAHLSVLVLLVVCSITGTASTAIAALVLHTVSLLDATLGFWLSTGLLIGTLTAYLARSGAEPVRVATPPGGSTPHASEGPPPGTSASTPAPQDVPAASIPGASATRRLQRLRLGFAVSGAGVCGLLLFAGGAPATARIPQALETAGAGVFLALLTHVVATSMANLAHTLRR